MAMMPDETFVTPDMELAAVLCVNGAPFPETDRRSNSRSYFVFSDPDGELAWQAEQYRMSDPALVTVSVKDLFKAYGLLKRSLGMKPGARQ